MPSANGKVIIDNDNRHRGFHKHSGLETVLSTSLQESPQKAKVRVFAYGQTQPLTMAGMFETVIAQGNTEVQIKVYVAKHGHGMLLSGQTAEALGLIHFTLSVHTTGLEAILEEFQDLFKGIGCLWDKEVRLHIDRSIKPVVLRHRRISFHLQAMMEEVLRKLEKTGIIEKVEGPNLWVSLIVVIQKPN